MSANYRTNSRFSSAFSGSQCPRDNSNGLDSPRENKSWRYDFNSRLKNPSLPPATAIEEDQLNHHFDQIKLAREILKQLYSPLEDYCKSILSNSDDTRGKQRYNQWKKQKCKQLTLNDYNEGCFQAHYTLNNFLCSATRLMQAFEMCIIPSEPLVEDFLSRIKRVVSVGMGPCIDVAGFVAYLRSKGLNHRLVYHGIDQCPSWFDLVKVCDNHWCRKWGVSIWFKESLFGAPPTAETVATMPDTDMLVFSFADTINLDPEVWPLLKTRVPLIVIMDGHKKDIIDQFKKEDFKLFALSEKTNLYYWFSE